MVTKTVVLFWKKSFRINEKTVTSYPVQANPSFHHSLAAFGKISVRERTQGGD